MIVLHVQDHRWCRCYAAVCLSMVFDKEYIYNLKLLLPLSGPMEFVLFIHQNVVEETRNISRFRVALLPSDASMQVF